MLDLLPPPLRSRPPLIRCRNSAGNGRKTCIAAMLLADGEKEHARRWAASRPAFDSHLVYPFRPRGANGPRVVSSFCPICESLRSGVKPIVFDLLPWAIDVEGRTMPIDRDGPLSPRPDSRPIERMPAGWTAQSKAVADVFGAPGFRRTTRPDLPVDHLIDAVGRRTDHRIPAGVLVAAAALADVGFSVLRNGTRTRLSLNPRAVSPMADAISERLTGSSE